MSFFWSTEHKYRHNKRVIKKNSNLCLTVELDEELAGLAIPDTHSAVLATREDVILICIDGCDCSSVRLSYLPELRLGLYCIEAAEESIAVSNDDRVVIFGEENAASPCLPCWITGK